MRTTKSKIERRRCKHACARQRVNGGVEDWWVPRRESNVSEHEVDVNAPIIIGIGREASFILETSWYHVGQIGAVKRSRARDEHRCKNKDNKKHNG